MRAVRAGICNDNRVDSNEEQEVGSGGWRWWNHESSVVRGQSRKGQDGLKGKEPSETKNRA